MTWILRATVIRVSVAGLNNAKQMKEKKIPISFYIFSFYSRSFRLPVLFSRFFSAFRQHVIVDYCFSIHIHQTVESKAIEFCVSVASHMKFKSWGLLAFSSVFFFVYLSQEMNDIKNDEMKKIALPQVKMRNGKTMNPLSYVWTHEQEQKNTKIIINYLAFCVDAIIINMTTKTSAQCREIKKGRIDSFVCEVSFPSLSVVPSYVASCAISTEMTTQSKSRSCFY